MNRYFIQYALGALLRSRGKNIFIVSIFSFLVFIISSVFFITNSMKFELEKTIEDLPQITIQKLQGGRIVPIQASFVDEVLLVTGVQSAIPRVWGYYFYQNAGVNFSIVGIDGFEKQYTKQLQYLVDTDKNMEIFDNQKMIVGHGVQKILQENFFDGYFNFILNDGSFKKIEVGGVFDSSIQLQSNDMILVNKDLAYELLGYDEHQATDIVAHVANPEELSTVVEKIKLLDPNTRIITNEDYQVSYQNMFDYKSGVFLALFITSLSAFFIIVFDKASGLSSNERKEIGILKALGWKIEDVLKEKFYESFIVSFLSYLLGVFIALFFVYGLQAPVLRSVFEGYSVLKTTFELPFVLDLQTLTLVFFITVPLYIGATLIPAYKASITEADEVIR